MSYSQFFKVKLGIQYTQALIAIGVFLLLLLDSVYEDRNSKAGIYSFLQLITSISWIVSGILLQYEYRKRLSEGLFTH
jgi:hypothetical protein